MLSIHARLSLFVPFQRAPGQPRSMDWAIPSCRACSHRAPASVDRAFRSALCFVFRPTTHTLTTSCGQRRAHRETTSKAEYAAKAACSLKASVEVGVFTARFGAPHALSQRAATFNRPRTGKCIRKFGPLGRFGFLSLQSASLQMKKAKCPLSPGYCRGEAQVETEHPCLAPLAPEQ